MKKIIALIFIILFLTASSNVQHADPIHLFQEAHFAIGEHSQEMEWNLLIKESIAPNDINNYLKRDKNRTLVTGKNDEKEVQYIMDLSNAQEMSATLTITHYKEAGQAEMSVEIKGTNWSMQTEEQYDSIVTDIQRTYFSPKARVYACLKATYNATIYRNDIEEVIKKSFQLEDLSELMDPLTDPEEQRTWYGYTPRLTETMTIENEQTNVQIVVNTKDKQQFTVIIGTPIVIHEY